MLATDAFGAKLESLGFDFFSGVPCSFLKDLFNYSINAGRFVMAASEGDAVAICSGAFLAGRKPVFLCQNSGLANAVSPLTSLNPVFRIPLLGFVSLRGEPGLGDEPQHELMGVITQELLGVMRIENAVLSSEPREAENQLEKAAAAISNDRSFFFIVRKGTFGPVKLDAPELSNCQERKTVIAAARNLKPPPEKESFKTSKRSEMIAALSTARGKRDIFIATTGKTGRELYEICDAPGNFYMVGSMGCAGQIALGLAMNRPELRVTALDGDGALLMRAGSMATNGWYAPSNMLHILFDNRSHDSTGGQFTVSPGVDFILAATAFGYEKALKVADADELVKAFEDWKKTGGLTFIHAGVPPSPAETPGRPKIKPFEVKLRLMEYVAEIIRGGADD